MRKTALCTNQSCENCCDRNMKENFASVESQAILNRLSRIPIETWNYTWDDPSVRHISPMAQDFAAAFAVGEDDKHIHPIDVSGVAFASIQALFQNLQQTRLELQTLQAELEEYERSRTDDSSSPGSTGSRSKED